MMNFIYPKSLSRSNNRLFRVNFIHNQSGSFTPENLLNLIKGNKPLELVRTLRESAGIVSQSANKITAVDVSPCFPVLFGSETSEDGISLTKEVMNFVDTIIPYTSYNASISLINYFCDKDDIETALQYYSIIQKSSLALDAATFEKFVGKLCDNAMVDEIEEVLKIQKPTLLLADRMIEPYVLSGRIYEFSGHLDNMLESNAILTQLGMVSNFVEVLLKSRLRRAISGATKTLSEMVGVDNVHKSLSKFFTILESLQEMEEGPPGLGRCAATIYYYLEYCKEQWDDETVPAPLPLDSNDQQAVEAIVLAEQQRTFKYLIEHRHFYDNGCFLEDSPFDVLDITAELAMEKLNPPLLYQASLFHNARQDEQRFVTLISNDILDLQVLRVFDETMEKLEHMEELERSEENDEDDADFDDDFDDNSFEDENHSIKTVDEGKRGANEDDDWNDDADFDDEDEDFEKVEKLAESRPRKRINDLSRSLHASFGRYRLTFDDDFFDEMEIISYELPMASINSIPIIKFKPEEKTPDDDGGTVIKSSLLPRDAEFSKK